MCCVIKYQQTFFFTTEAIKLLITDLDVANVGKQFFLCLFAQIQNPHLRCLSAKFLLLFTIRAFKINPLNPHAPNTHARTHTHVYTHGELINKKYTYNLNLSDHVYHKVDILAVQMRHCTFFLLLTFSFALSPWFALFSPVATVFHARVQIENLLCTYSSFPFCT